MLTWEFERTNVIRGFLAKSTTTVEWIQSGRDRYPLARGRHPQANQWFSSTPSACKRHRETEEINERVTEKRISLQWRSSGPLRWSEIWLHLSFHSKFPVHRTDAAVLNEGVLTCRGASLLMTTSICLCLSLHSSTSDPQASSIKRMHSQQGTPQLRPRDHSTHTISNTVLLSGFAPSWPNKIRTSTDTKDFNNKLKQWQEEPLPFFTNSKFKSKSWNKFSFIGFETSVPYVTVRVEVFVSRRRSSDWLQSLDIGSDSDIGQLWAASLIL